MAKIVFLQYIWFEWIGIMSISAFLKKHGHSCEVVIGTKEETIKELKQIQPDIIAISSMTSQHEQIYEIAKAIKWAGLKSVVVVGGAHPTFAPTMLEEEGIDIICRGEGEYPMLELAEALDKGKDYSRIQNLWVKKKGKIIKNEMRQLVEDLDSLPFPDRELYNKYPKYFEDKTFETFIVTRGCPFQCTFCFNHAFAKLYKGKGRFVRFRSVDSVIQEVKEVTRKFHSRSVVFADSTFNIHKRWLLEFLQKYKEEIDVPFTVNFRADLVDEEIVKAVADTGKCSLIRFGVESGNEKLRNNVLKKSLTDKQIYEAARLFKKYNVKFFCYAMMGLPSETLANAFQTIEMLRKLDSYGVDIGVYMAYPNLELTDYAIHLGAMTENDYWKLSVNPYRFYMSILDQKDIKKVCNLHKFSIVLIKMPFLTPVVKDLIKLPSNFVFNSVYLMTQAYYWKKASNATTYRILKEMYFNFKRMA